MTMILRVAGVSEAAFTVKSEFVVLKLLGGAH